MENKGQSELTEPTRDRDALIELIKERSFEKRESPSFPLSSGKKSRYYFNLKNVTLSPDGMALVGRLVYDKIQQLKLKPKAIGGPSMGADPIAHVTAFTSYLEKNPIQAFAIRKAPKKHGLKLQIEGNVTKDDEVIIVDDVVTTGKSTIDAINIAREHGLKVQGVIVIVDRCEENGKENIEGKGTTVHSILTIRDFL